MQKIFRHSITTLFTVFVLAVLSSNISKAQSNEYKRFIGKWITGPNQENYMKIGDNYVRVYLYIEDVDGILYSRMESPDADVFNMPGEETTSSGDKIKIYFKQLDAIYRGEINRGNTQITGALAFLGKTVPLGFVKVMVEPNMLK